MRCVQPFIPINRRLGKPILGLRSLGLTQPDFSKSIASKYSGLKQQKFNFPEFVLLKSPREHLHVNNITRILNNQVISALRSKILLDLNLNLSFFLNQAVQRLGINAIPLSLRQPQAVKLPTSSPDSANVTSQILVSKTQEIKELRKTLRLNLRTADQDGNKPWFVNLVVQKFAITKSQQVLVSQSSAYSVTNFLSFRQSPTVGIPAYETGINNETPQRRSRQIKKTSSTLQIPVIQTGSSTLLTAIQKRLLIHSTAIHRQLIHSITKTSSALTLEQTPHFTQRLQTLETQSIMQSQKAAIYSLADLNLAPHHIRTRKLNQKSIRLSEPFPNHENLVLQRQIFKTAGKNQSNEKYSPYSREPVREFAQSKTNFSPVPTNQENSRANDIAKLKPPELGMPMIDVNRLADQVYQVIERKIKIERQRRGML